MPHILDSKYKEPERPYSQSELELNRSRLYKNLRLGTHKAYHSKCRHFYKVRQNGRKEKEIIEQQTNDIGNCSVCWKLYKTHIKHKRVANQIVEDYSNVYYNEPSYLSYNNVDLETVFYKWLYEDQDRQSFNKNDETHDETRDETHDETRDETHSKTHSKTWDKTHSKTHSKTWDKTPSKM